MMIIMYITQISVYLENDHGTLRTLTKTLAEAGIDMLGMSIADTANFGIARIVVREADFNTAITALINAGFMARKNQVLCAAVPNKPAGLDSVLAVIEANGIFIEYMYSFNYNLDGSALLILRLSSDDKDEAAIAAAGVVWFDENVMNDENAVLKIGAIYGLVQLIASLVFMALAAWVPVWVTVLVYAIALGAAVIGLISAEAVVSEIKVQDVKLKKDVTLMRSLQSKVNQMASQCDNPDAAAAVKQFAEEMRYSDPVSSEALSEIEADLSAVVDELQAAIVEVDSAATKQLCRKASAVLAERNRLCKLNKT